MKCKSANEKNNEPKSRNAAAAIAFANGSGLAIFVFRHLTAFFGPLEARRTYMCKKLLKCGNFEWQITHRTRIETWSPKDQLYLNWIVFVSLRT